MTSNRPTESQKLTADFTAKRIINTSSSLSSSTHALVGTGSLAKVTSRTTVPHTPVDDLSLSTHNDVNVDNTTNSSNTITSLTPGTHTVPVTSLPSHSLSSNDSNTMNEMMSMMRLLLQKQEEQEKRHEDLKREIIKVKQENEELINQKVKSEITSVENGNNDSSKLEEITTPLKSEPDNRERLARSEKSTKSKTNKNTGIIKGQLKDDKFDEEVIEYESEDEVHEYGSYVEWLLKRERMYPFSKRFKLYKNRCTLLSYNGRMCEYYRFGCHVDFDVRLYPYQLNRWFLRHLMEKGEYKPSKPIRPVDWRSAKFPEWSISVDDVTLATRSRDDPDIPPHSATLSGLPVELQVDPPTQSVYYMSNPNMEKMVHRYRYHNLLLNAGKPAESDKSKTILSLSSKAVKTEPSYEDLPALENNDFSSSSSHSCVSSYTPAKSSSNSFSTPSAVYHNSDQYLRKVKTEQQEIEGSQHNSSEFESLKDKSVLGSILECFDEGTKAMILATRQTRAMTASEINKQVSNVSAKLPKFNGNAEKAPAYLLELCQEVARVPFDHSDVIMIMSNTMTETAKEWLTSKIIDIARVSDDMKIPTLLGAYRDQYMNVTHVISYQERLNSLRLSDINVTLSDLRAHYTSFNKLKNNLRLCDKSISEESMRRQYVTSLPSKIRNYIGVAYKDCYSIDAVHQLAEEACRTNLPKNRLDKEEEIVNLNAIESYSEKDYDYYDDEYDDEIIPEKDVQHMWFLAHSIRNNIAKRDIVCWHCGNRGHYAGGCPINVKGSPQTPKGAAYYASFNRMRGEVRTYDPEIQKSKHDRYMRSYMREENNDNAENSSSSSPSSSSFRPSIKGKSRLVKPYKNVKSVKEKSSVGNNSEDAIEVSSHIIELPQNSSECDDNIDTGEVSKQVFQMFTITDVNNTSKQDILQTEAQESRSANSMCLPVEINGHAFGYVLADQGCNRSCVRASALRRHGIEVDEHKLTNQFLLCSSGEEIPIRSRFKATISSKGKTIGDSLIYVVEDKPDADIVCDMVIGRSTLSSGDYNCIDTKKGTLFNKKTGAEILCYPGKIVDTETGRKNIVPKHASDEKNDA